MDFYAMVGYFTKQHGIYIYFLNTSRILTTRFIASFIKSM